MPNEIGEGHLGWADAVRQIYEVDGGERMTEDSTGYVMF
jgi:hypothetical protein